HSPPFYLHTTATPEIYTLSLHDALPIYAWCISHAERVTHTIQEIQDDADESSLTEASAHIVLLALSLAASAPTSMTPQRDTPQRDRKSTRLNSSHVAISYAVFCLKKKT